VALKAAVNGLLRASLNIFYGKCTESVRVRQLRKREVDVGGYLALSSGTFRLESRSDSFVGASRVGAAKTLSRSIQNLSRLGRNLDQKA
jgi:hypothetical protein